MDQTEVFTSLLKHLADECRFALLLPDDRIAVPGQASNERAIKEAAMSFVVGASRVVAFGPMAALSSGSPSPINEQVVRDRLGKWRAWCDIPGVGHQYGSLMLVAIMAGDALSNEEIIGRSKNIQDDLRNWRDLTGKLFDTWIGGTKLGVFATVVVLFRESERARKFASDAIHKCKATTFWSMCHTMTWAVDLSSGSVERSKGLPNPSFRLDKNWRK